MDGGRRTALARLVSSALLAGLTGIGGTQVNLAAAREGAQVVGSSSSWGRGYEARNLVDGDGRTSWATAEGKVEKEWVMVRLAGGRSVEIGSIALDNSPTGGHPAEAGVRNFELSVSTLGRNEEDFRRILLDSCRLGAGRQVFTFTAARAKYVKLIARSNFGGPRYMEANELAVYAAGAALAGRGESAGVLLLTGEGGGVAGPLASLSEALSQAGAAVTSTTPGGAGRRLSAGHLVGMRAAVVPSEAPLTKDEAELLERFCRRGGGLVCEVAPESSLGRTLVQALGVGFAGPAEAGGTVTLSPHWITEGLALPPAAEASEALTLAGSAALAQRGASVVGLAGEVDSGRLVVLPHELLMSVAPGDGLELARRAVLYAAGMEEVAMPAGPPAPVVLTGRAALLAPREGPPSFTRLEEALTERGLGVRRLSGPAGELTVEELTSERSLIAFMPQLGPGTSRALADWVKGGGALLVLGDAEAPAAELMRVNEFLREFGVAMTAAPAKNLGVVVESHPATAGIDALSRPGSMLGVWCLQGQTLAQMTGTPVALARSFGAGRLIAMDAGLAVDPAQPPPDRKKPPPPHGIQLAQNEEFVVRCVAWLVTANGGDG